MTLQGNNALLGRKFSQGLDQNSAFEGWQDMKPGNGDYSNFKEGVSRYHKAMQGMPDRVPVYAQIHDFARKELGVGAKEFYTDPELLVEGSLETINRWGIDYPVIGYDVYNIEAEALGQKIIFSDDGIPDIDRATPLIQSREDLKKIKTPDFNSDGRFPKVIEMYSLFKELTHLEPGLEFSAPFTLATSIRGIENLIMDIFEDPGFAKELLDRVTDLVLIPWIRHLQQKFPNSPAIGGADAMSSLPIINMEMLRKWSAPYIRHLRDVLGPQVYVANWVGEQYLKDPTEMFDLKLQVCPNFLEGQDPDVEAIGPEIYKAYAQKKGIPLVLGIGAAFLTLSTPAEIENRIRYYIEVGGRDGRFCLYLCNVDSSTPPANLQAVMGAIHRYGTY